MTANRTPQTTTVVGAGIGGLITACRLAQSGARVTVVDGADPDHLGGRARSLVLGGLPVNPGPRAMYRGLALESALRDLDIVPAGWAPPATGGFVLKGNTLHGLPSSLASLLSTPLLRQPGARREMALLLARITVGAFDVRAGESIRRWIDRHVTTDDARALVAVLARVATYAPVGFDDDADQLDALTTLTNIRAAATRGVRYLDGGWSSIVTALLEKAKQLGVDVVQHAPAAHVDDGVVTLRDGRRFEADAVVVATPPQQAGALLSRTFSTTALPAACLDLVLERLPVPTQRFVLGVDDPLYFSLHTQAASASPVVVHVARYGGGSREALEAFVDVVQPGWRAQVRAARFLPKMIVMHDLPKAGQRRVDAVVDDRTLLVGDWVEGPGLLADASAASAVRVAQLLSSSPSSSSPGARRAA